MIASYLYKSTHSPGFRFLHSETDLDDELLEQRLICLRLHTLFLVAVWAIGFFPSWNALDNTAGMITVMAFMFVCSLLVYLVVKVFPFRQPSRLNNLKTSCYVMYAVLAVMPFCCYLSALSISWKLVLIASISLIHSTTGIFLHLPFQVVVLSLICIFLGLLLVDFHIGSRHHQHLVFLGFAMAVELLGVYRIHQNTWKQLVLQKECVVSADDKIESRAQDLKRAYLREMIHEIGTPLMVLSLGNEALQELVKICPEILRIVKTNNQALDMMIRLRERAIDITRESEGATLRPTLGKVNIRHLVYNRCQNIMTAFNSSNASVRVQVSYSVEDSVPKWVNSDADFIWDMLICLLSNAKKYTNKGCIKTHVTHDTEENMIYFKVSDTGIGVKLEHREKLFQPFSQFQAGTGGTGLGLYSVKLKAEALHGKVGYCDLSRGQQSSPDHSGSLFWFSIPYHPAEELKDSLGRSRKKSTIGILNRILSSSAVSSIKDGDPNPRESSSHDSDDMRGINTERSRSFMLGPNRRLKSSHPLLFLKKRILADSSLTPRVPGDTDSISINSVRVDPHVEPKRERAAFPGSSTLLPVEENLKSFSGSENLDSLSENKALKRHLPSPVWKGKAWTPAKNLTLCTDDSNTAFADGRNLHGVALSSPMWLNKGLSNTKTQTTIYQEPFHNRGENAPTSPSFGRKSPSRSVDFINEEYVDSSIFSKKLISPAKRSEFFPEEDMSLSSSGLASARKQPTHHMNPPETAKNKWGPQQGKRTVVTTIQQRRKSSVCEHTVDWEECSQDNRVLLIEDEKIILKMMHRMLGKEGLIVDLAENGRVGLQKLMESQYCCVFCDLTMPEMDGYEAVEQFRKWEAGKNDRSHKPQYVCALSANSDEQSRTKAKIAGFNNFISKPSTLKVLLDEINQAKRMSQAGTFLNENATSNHN